MLKINNLSKKFKGFHLENLNIHIKSGDYCVVLGVSGAGKSILLEMIAGLISLDSGEIFLDGEDISYKKIQGRNIGLVFQDYAIFPHLSVRQNIEYPLKSLKKGKKERAVLCENIAKELNIHQLLERKPSTLSGGELQRTALARTLVTEPKILLLDEPLSSLDVILRNDLKDLLRKINRKGLTILHVTHDYEDVISLANHVVVIEKGKVIQTGTPKEIFLNPRSRFIAHLSGIKNFFPAQITQDQQTKEKIAIIHNEIRIVLLTELTDTNGNIIIDSEGIIVSEHKLDSSIANNFEGKVKDVVEMPVGMEISIDIGVILYVTLTKSSFAKLNIRPEKKLWLSFKASGVRFYN